MGAAGAMRGRVRRTGSLGEGLSSFGNSLPEHWIIGMEVFVVHVVNRGIRSDRNKRIRRGRGSDRLLRGCGRDGVRDAVSGWSMLGNRRSGRGDANFRIKVRGLLLGSPGTENNFDLFSGIGSGEITDAFPD